MGVRCSKYGNVHEEESLCGDHFRLSPEGGECEMGPRILDLSSCNDLAMLTTRKPVKTKYGGPLSSLKRLGCDREAADDVAKDQCTEGYSLPVSMDLQHHSPPEGKVDVEQLFVELPRENALAMKNDLTVCLEPETSSALERTQDPVGSDGMSACAREMLAVGTVDKMDALSRPYSQSDCSSVASGVDSRDSCTSRPSNGSPGSVPSDEEASEMEREGKNLFWRKVSHPIENDWTYTLYDYEGRGVDTKQDLQELMQSICLVIGSSVMRASHCKDISDRSVKLRLEIGHQNQKSVHSPNKYTPSKNYNGFLFPPPNSAEADKVSSYIEKKLALHRGSVSHRRERHLQKNPRHRHHDCLGSNLRPERQEVHSLPKRQQTYPGGPCAPRGKCGPVESRQARSVDTSEKSTVAWPDRRISQVRSFDFASSSSSPTDTQRQSSSCSSASSSSSAAQTISVEDCNVRLRHSCSQHRRLKEDRIKRQSSSSSDSIRSERLRPAAARKHGLAHPELVSVKNFRNSDISSCSLAPGVVGEFSSSSSAVLKSVDPAASRLESGRRADLSRAASCRTTSPGQVLSPQENCRRPAVWPGRSVDATTSIGEDVITATESIPCAAVFTASCFCKRMLGESQPCCSSVPLPLTHEHERRHYHYIEPGTGAVR